MRENEMCDLYSFEYLILDLAIDDLSIRTGTCQSTTPPQNMYKCLDGTLIPKTKVSLKFNKKK